MHDCILAAALPWHWRIATRFALRNLNGTIYISENESFSTGRWENFSSEIASEHALFIKPSSFIFINSFLAIHYQSLLNRYLVISLTIKNLTKHFALNVVALYIKIKTILYTKNLLKFFHFTLLISFLIKCIDKDWCFINVHKMTKLYNKRQYD